VSVSKEDFKSFLLGINFPDLEAQLESLLLTLQDSNVFF
jgi:hypothetical protein